MKLIKNVQEQGELHTKSGIYLAAGVYVDITTDAALFCDQQTFGRLGSGAWIYNDGTADVTDPLKAWDMLRGKYAVVEIDKQPAPSPFAAKTFGIYKFFKRIHGMTQAVTTGENTVLYTITYPWAKITGVEIVGSDIGDKACLSVLDSDAGLISGTPNLLLNQFGFTVNMPKDSYRYESKFDADLYQGLKIKITYNSISNKTIGINIILDEVKT